MAIETRQITSRDEWLEWRKKFVTASRVGGLPAFNCHPFYTPLRIYAELRGVEFPNDDNPVLRRGRWLEPAVAKAFTELRPELGLELPGVFLCDEAIGIGATPDYYITGDARGRGVLQVKTVSPSVYQREWANGEEIPLWITLQTLTEAMLADAAFGVVAVMLVDPHYMDVKLLDVPRHAGAEGKVVAEVIRFMAETRNGIEPEADFARDSAVLKLLLPREQPGKTIDLSNNNRASALLGLRAQAKAEIKRNEKLCDTIENELKVLIGDAERVVGLNDWGVTFKTTPYKAYTVKAREVRVLRVRDKRPAEQRPDTDDEDIEP